MENFHEKILELLEVIKKLELKYQTYHVFLSSLFYFT